MKRRFVGRFLNRNRFAAVARRLLIQSATGCESLERDGPQVNKLKSLWELL